MTRISVQSNRCSVELTSFSGSATMSTELSGSRSARTRNCPFPPRAESTVKKVALASLLEPSPDTWSGRRGRAVANSPRVDWLTRAEPSGARSST